MFHIVALKVHAKKRLPEQFYLARCGRHRVSTLICQLDIYMFKGPPSNRGQVLRSDKTAARRQCRRQLSGRHTRGQKCER